MGAAKLVDRRSSRRVRAPPGNGRSYRWVAYGGVNLGPLAEQGIIAADVCVKVVEGEGGIYEVVGIPVPDPFPLAIVLFFQSNISYYEEEASIRKLRSLMRVLRFLFLAS